MLLAIEAGAVKESSGFLKRVKGSRSFHRGVRYQGVGHRGVGHRGVGHQGGCHRDGFCAAFDLSPGSSGFLDIFSWDFRFPRAASVSEIGANLRASESWCQPA